MQAIEAGQKTKQSFLCLVVVFTFVLPRFTRKFCLCSPLHLHHSCEPGFNGQTFQQIHGVSVDSYLSPVLANILTEFEKVVISDFDQTGIINLYRQYVDDSVLYS